jgi:hypothetical protein
MASLGATVWDKPIGSNKLNILGKALFNNIIINH